MLVSSTTVVNAATQQTATMQTLPQLVYDGVAIFQNDLTHIKLRRQLDCLQPPAPSTITDNLL